MGENREGLFSQVTYLISTKYNRRFDVFPRFLLRSIESRDFCSKVVVIVRSKQRKTSVLGSEGRPPNPVIRSQSNNPQRIHFLDLPFCERLWE